MQLPVVHLKFRPARASCRTPFTGYRPPLSVSLIRYSVGGESRESLVGEGAPIIWKSFPIPFESQTFRSGLSFKVLSSMILDCPALQTHLPAFFALDFRSHDYPLLPRTHLMALLHWGHCCSSSKTQLRLRRP